MFMLQVFLTDLDLYIDKEYTGKTADITTVFANYFLLNDYISKFEGTKNELFAKRLA